MSKAFFFTIFLLLTIPSIIQAQIFNQHQLQVRDYEIKYQNDVISIDTNFKKVDEYHDNQNNKLYVYEFTYNVKDVTHSSQIMVVDLHASIAKSDNKFRVYWNKIYDDLKEDGFWSLRSIKVRREIIYYNKTASESPKVLIKGRVFHDLGNIYFVTSEIKSDNPDINIGQWQKKFFENVLINRVSMSF